MFGVAARAFLAGARRDVVGSMEPFVSLKPAGNFSMTFQALKGRLAAELVTGHTVGRSV